MSSQLPPGAPAPSNDPALSWTHYSGPVSNMQAALVSRRSYPSSGAAARPPTLHRFLARGLGCMHTRASSLRQDPIIGSRSGQRVQEHRRRVISGSLRAGGCSFFARVGMPHPAGAETKRRRPRSAWRFRMRIACWVSSSSGSKPVTVQAIAPAGTGGGLLPFSAGVSVGCWLVGCCVVGAIGTVAAAS